MLLKLTEPVMQSDNKKIRSRLDPDMLLERGAEIPARALQHSVKLVQKSSTEQYRQATGCWQRCQTAQSNQCNEEKPRHFGTRSGQA